MSNIRLHGKDLKQKSPSGVKTNFNYTTIGLAMLGGAVIGGGAFAAKQYFDNYKTKRYRATPDAPNLEQLAPSMNNLFYVLITRYYRIVPEGLQEKYKESIREAIYNAEIAFAIENQLLNKEVYPSIELKTTASTFMMRSMMALKEMLNCFRTHLVQDVAEIVDSINWIFTTHSNNIDILIDNGSSSTMA